MAAFRTLVDDVDAALAFYRALGFRLSERWGPPFAIVKGHGLTIWLSGPGTSARKKLKSGALPAPGGWNRIVIPVKDINATVARLEALGLRFRSKPIKGPGGQQALVEDPSGNPVEIFEPRESAG
jgi:catechol 2,3-dioxygenase-like lactoylglutathione lyase family enzyme